MGFTTFIMGYLATKQHPRPPWGERTTPIMRTLEINHSQPSSSKDNNTGQRKPMLRENGSTRKVSGLQIVLLCLTCLFTGTEATSWQASDPMICGMTSSNSPLTFNVHHDYKYTANKDGSKNMESQEVEIQIYQQQMIEREDVAYQCTKFWSTITTQIFFKDIKTRTAYSVIEPVRVEEYRNMMLNKKCQAESLEGRDVVYTTNNKVKAQYVW